MNDFQMIELAYRRAKGLFSKGVSYISVNPSFCMVKESDVDKLFVGFLHIFYVDENKESYMFRFETVKELLSEIDRLLEK